MGSKEGLGSKKNGKGIQLLLEPKVIGEKLGGSNAVMGIKEGDGRSSVISHASSSFQEVKILPT